MNLAAHVYTLSFTPRAKVLHERNLDTSYMHSLKERAPTTIFVSHVIVTATRLGMTCSHIVIQRYTTVGQRALQISNLLVAYC